MHLTSKWHQEAGGSLGSWEVGQLFCVPGTPYFSPRVGGQRAPYPKGSELGNNGPSAPSEIGQR